MVTPSFAELFLQAAPHEPARIHLLICRKAGQPLAKSELSLKNNVKLV
jgi:hypothetical protein